MEDGGSAKKLAADFDSFEYPEIPEIYDKSEVPTRQTEFKKKNIGEVVEAAAWEEEHLKSFTEF